MQLINALCIPSEPGGMNAILSLAGKDLIYAKRNNRYGWIGKTLKLTENGAVVLFRNGKEQSYSIDTFVATFAPAHWSKNTGFRTESMALAVNRHSYTSQVLEGPSQHALAIDEKGCDSSRHKEITQLGEFYVWRRNGGMPTKMHSIFDDAVEEAERIAKLNPDEDVLVLSIAASLFNKTVKSHQLHVSIR